jgi:import receptor subunit TOM22
MVKVSIVDEKDSGNSPYGSASSSQASSSSLSLSSVSSDSPQSESIVERIAALVDIVPPETRQNISSKLAATSSILKTSGKVIGNVVWIVTTTALLVGLPLILILEDEAKIVNEEKNMMAQQQGVQQVITRLLIKRAVLKFVCR